MFFKFFKFIIPLFVLTALVIPSASQAFDQRCWTKTGCEAGGGGGAGLGGVFYQTDETAQACGGATTLGSSGANEPVGFCLAAGTAETKIDYGGKSSFTNIGEFIKWIYKYGVVVAGSFAVVMIMVAGFQWATSGGNPEGISSARKRIGGAMMGLFLAVMSYFILNMINPYLVNLRMPQVWMINTAGLTPPYCDLLKDKKVSEKDGGPFNLDPIKDPINASFCGKEYFVEGSALTCLGRSCNRGVCMDSGEVDVKSKPVYKCDNGILGGKISADKPLMCGDLTGAIFDNNIMLIAICKNGGDIEKVWDKNLVDKNKGEKTGRYLIPRTIEPQIESACSSRGGPVGFYLAGEINDEGTTLGVIDFCSGNPLASGCDDWHAIGISSPGSCNFNLANAAQKILLGKPNICAKTDDSKLCSCGSFSDESKILKISQDPEFLKHLISKEDLLKGYVCDIFIDRSVFPRLNNSCVLDDDSDCWDDQNSL